MSVSTFPALRASDCRSAWCQRGSRSCRWESPSTWARLYRVALATRKSPLWRRSKRPLSGLQAQSIGSQSRWDWNVERVAVDAPAAPPTANSRASEDELGRLGLSSFRTPAASAWDGIKQKCVEHLGSGGSTATLPHANKIWMLFGFELFSSLRASLGIEVIEVYPFAIVRASLSACEHKSTEQGYRNQLVAVAARTGWRPQDLEAKLRATVPGSRHDRLDAFMAAWVAALPREQRRAIGDAEHPDDAIWVLCRLRSTT